MINWLYYIGDNGRLITSQVLKSYYYWGSSLLSLLRNKMDLMLGWGVDDHDITCNLIVACIHNRGKIREE